MQSKVLSSGKEFSIIRSKKDGEATFVLKSASKTSLTRIQKLKPNNEGSFIGETIKGLRKVLEFENTTTEYHLTLEYINGYTLEDLLPKIKTQADKINVCIKIAQTLSVLHSNQIIHLNLNPRHILIEKKTNKVYFISLGLSKRLQSKIIDQDKLLFTQADQDYIAPEQTGRISTDVGYSSDIYSLGIIFYKLFTDHLPFENKNGMAKIHAHIALTPAIPDKISNTPKIISDLILKMIEKDTEKRYHSADGISHDLIEISNHLDQEEWQLNFKLGKNDSSENLRLSNKLYGREEQISQLMIAFNRTLQGTKQLLLVSGPSGVGKSSLVEQLYRPVLNEGGVFVSGKFDSLKMDVPYFAFSQAFDRLLEHIEISSKEMIQTWKTELHNKLHPIGRVLFDIIPGLENLLDNQPEIPDLDGLESQSRFNYAMNSFLQIVSTLCKPFVIFIDDLQWSDTSSLSLIKNILNNDELKNILIIGAYRDNEITSGHIFLQFMMEVENITTLPKIKLDNLNPTDVKNLVQSTIGHSDTDINELSTLVYKKSGGNAFFVNQFIKSVHNNKILYFERNSRTWKWDPEKILEFNMEGDIVDLLLETINKLNHETISILKFASCIGNKFNLNLLSKATEKNIEFIQSNLKSAIKIGLIIEAKNNNYYFVHDRIQQALYFLTDDMVKGKFHLEIGRLILLHTPKNQIRDSIYDIVKQFNLARDLITEPSERKRVCELNFIAGKRSQNATAYSVAFRYFENALHFLDRDAWLSSYHFTLNLYLQAASAANQCNNKERFEKLIAVGDQHANQTVDKLKFADLKIQNSISDNDHNSVIKIGLSAIKHIRIDIKSNPSQLDVLYGFTLTNFRISRFKNEEILKLPLLENEELIIAMGILHRVSYAAYFIRPNLVPVIMFELIKITLKNGLGPKSAIAFIIFGYINISFMNKAQRGIQMGQLGNRISEIHIYEEQISSIKQAYHTFISHWIMHLGKTIPDLEAGFKKGLETGDFEFTAINGHLIIYWNFYSGEPIEKVLKRGRLLNLQVTPLNQPVTLARINLFRQSVIGLLEGVVDFDQLEGEVFNEKDFHFPDEPAFNLYFHNIHMQKKFLAIVFNEHTIAWEYCCKEKQYMVPVKGTVTEMLFYFYENICITHIYGSRTKEKQKQLKTICKKNIKLMESLVNISEINYIHRFQLMQAEYYQLNKKNDKAIQFYSEAIKNAKLNRFIQDEALAWERTGMFYRSLNQEEIARFYFTNAYKTYEKWGAVAKLDHMKDEYHDLISMEDIGFKNNSLDLATVLKTVSLISGEIKLEKMLNGLMTLVAENAGAEKAVLVSNQKGEMIIKASVDTSINKVSLLQDFPYNEYNGISHSVVNLVSHKEEILVLDNAYETMPYANDDYISSNEIKSIVCLPLKHGGVSFAYLYLENHMITGAFTEQRIELLQVMATQTAISLQNAMLFEETSLLNKNLTEEIDSRKKIEETLRINEKRLEDYNVNLENKVQERTKDLQSEKKKTDNLLLNILPYNIAMELKETGKAEAKNFKSVSVLFTDFKGFTLIAESMGATELVAEIDYCFKEFDRIVQKYHIEKIKTIGDSYMAVGGLPVINNTHPEDLVRAALEIRDFMDEYNIKRMKKKKPVFEIRLGIHTGPVVAGIVGSNKFAYDIWGDTVNLASRMESSGEPGKVNVSSITYEHVKNKFSCMYRGKIEAKNKGAVEMYNVDW